MTYGTKKTTLILGCFALATAFYAIMLSDTGVLTTYQDLGLGLGNSQ